MNNKLAVILAIAFGAIPATVAAETFYQRVPAKVKCPEAGCARPVEATAVLPQIEGGPSNPGPTPGGGSGPVTPTAPLGQLDKNALSFDPITMGYSSTAQTVVVTNKGNASLSNFAISVVGTQGNFTQTNNCGGSLAPGQACSVWVTFSPKEAGQLSDQIAITTNANTMLAGVSGLSVSAPTVTAAFDAASVIRNEPNLLRWTTTGATAVQVVCLGGETASDLSGARTVYGDDNGGQCDVTAYNSLGFSVKASASFSPTAVTVALASAALPDARIGVPYSYDLKSNLTITGDKAYTGQGVTWSIAAGELPTGLFLSSNGVISGTPTLSGATSPYTSVINVKAEYKGFSSQRDYSLKKLYTQEDSVINAIGTGNGDGNGDGVQDSLQANVASLKTVVAGNPYITLESTIAGTDFANIEAKPTPSGLPRNVKLLVGNIHFNLTGVPVGQAVQISIYVPSNLAVNAWFVMNNTGNWANIAKSYSSFGTKTRIVVEVVDGGPYDLDGTANGVIVL